MLSPVGLNLDMVAALCTEDIAVGKKLSPAAFWADQALVCSDLRVLRQQFIIIIFNFGPKKVKLG